MATLVNITSNEIQEFKIGNYKFKCTPYGIYTLEELYRNSPNTSQCRKSISNFYKKRMDLRYFSHTKFITLQSYSLIFKQKKCIINVAGEKSYNEFLLDTGLGIKVPEKLDKEYDFVFHRSQREAKLSKRGLWGFNIAKECTSSIK
ncbi:MAG: hypothetical protein Q9M32_07230 [Sulfurimonas sp.]|nr:hypothetical protein [Sulfurimonas sp.]MDQ7061378.1 hypothetical protein [Sulfurimonas sp.]